MQNNQEVTLSSGKCILSPKHMKQFSFIKYSSNKFMDIFILALHCCIPPVKLKQWMERKREIERKLEREK